MTEEELVGRYILVMGAENADMEDNLSQEPENITLMPSEKKDLQKLVVQCESATRIIKQEQESD